MEKSDIGLIGLGVMGTNLARNIENAGFRVSVYNRPHASASDKIEKFKNEFGGGNFFATDNLEDFINSLSSPRKIILMIKAGGAVDEILSKLLPLLNSGDVVIDGGNSDFRDTRRRVEESEKRGIEYVGVGISGGEEGALKGASLMVSGSKKAWPKIKNIFRKIAAKADDGSPCCLWIGPEGSGHFVKMVHNAIEYGDMQLISEAYYILKNRNLLSNGEISNILKKWNAGDLSSYLIEITSKILDVKDADGTYVVDKILDAASQKGTGKLAVNAALENDVPFALIAGAIFARFASARLDERKMANLIFPEKNSEMFNAEISEDEIGRALYAAKIISYAQGFALLSAASEKYGWNLNFSGIAKIWRNGSIIRSVFLNRIADAFEKNSHLENILFDEYFAEKISQNADALRRVAAGAILNAIAAPCICAAISSFDTIRTEKSAANIIQAQRDYFGAHTYERIDRARGDFFHTDWLASERKDSKNNILSKS